MEVNFRKEYAYNASKEFDEGIKYIKPTIFNKDYTSNNRTTSSFIDDINTEIVFNKEILDVNQFVKIHPLLIINLAGKSESVFVVLGYFIQNIKYNSNCIKATIDDICSSIAVCKTSVKEAINYLCEKQVIAKTTIQSEYIINHNLMFKGSIEKFVKAYNKLYGGVYAKKDNKGKVIISKDIMNISRYESRKRI